MVYVNIVSAEHLYSVLRVCPKNNLRNETRLEKRAPGKVSAAVTAVFAVEGRVGAHREPGRGSLMITGVVELHS